jgi:hypothetical protein
MVSCAATPRVHRTTSVWLTSPAMRPVLGPGRNRLREETFTLGAFPGQFPRPADSFALPTRLGFGRLLVGRAGLHFPENALALHLFLESFQRLVDVVVPDHDNYDLKLSIAAPTMVAPSRITRPRYHGRSGLPTLPARRHALRPIRLRSLRRPPVPGAAPIAFRPKVREIAF